MMGSVLRPARDLVDGEAANEAALRNLLNRRGYPNLDEALRGSHQAGQDLGFKAGY